MVGREERKTNGLDTARHPRPVTRVLAFADIVGSSALVEAHELDAFHCVRRVLRLLRQEARALEGQIADEAGDGILVSFRCPRQGVSWATGVHRKVAKHCRVRATQQPLRLRIGIHIGEVLIYGARVFGRNVNIACRLQQAAAPGETLASVDVIDRIRGMSELSALPAGMVELKGMPTGIAAFRLDTTSAQAIERKEDVLSWLALPVGA